MFNNINENGDLFYNSQLERQSNIVNIALRKANYAKSKAEGKNPYVDRTEISSNAIELFQRDCDIKKFNQIAMSDLNDFSHLDRMKELFAEGVVDVFEDDIFKELSQNEKLYDDLGL